MRPLQIGSRNGRNADTSSLWSLYALCHSFSAPFPPWLFGVKCWSAPIRIFASKVSSSGSITSTDPKTLLSFPSLIATPKSSARILRTCYKGIFFRLRYWSSQCGFMPNLVLICMPPFCCSSSIYLISYKKFSDLRRNDRICEDSGNVWVGVSAGRSVPMLRGFSSSVVLQGVDGVDKLGGSQFASGWR